MTVTDRRVVFERRLRIVLIGFIALVLAADILDALFPPDLSRASRSSPVALDRHGGWLRALPVENGRWRIRADLDRTDPTFVRRLLSSEDGRFYWHLGVDPLSVLRAAASAAVHGRATSGASTLTMQTARLLTPHPRTWSDKLVEMLRAFQIEARLSKRQILALYLTLAPYGGNLQGVRAASLAYFGHEPTSLTDGEQALLIALPQSPEARRPDRHPVAARRARARVLERWVKAGLIEREAAREAAAEPLPHRASFPSLAWHVAGELAAKAPASDASVLTTIDADLQRRLEALSAGAARRQGADEQVCVLVVEIRDRAVRAAVGSSGRDRRGGWIDMTRSLRSPGSALKPFIYAFAFEDGLAAPDTQIDDAPRRFTDYQPEDFDRVFHGRVTAKEALVYSLNVPAVSLLSRIGAPAFEARMQATGARLVRERSGFRDAGLALALGGEGVTPRDLVMLYAALGDGGAAKPLAWTEKDAARTAYAKAIRMVRPAVAEEVLNILREGPPPAGRAPSALTRGGASLAFKTGTSYAFRDSLAAGVVGGYAIVVWAGRADGGARAGLTGRDVALPLLFDVADQIAAPMTATPRPLAPRGAPPALASLESESDGPRLIFPPDGATMVSTTYGPNSPGFVLAARGRDLHWFVDGDPLSVDPVGGQTTWRPRSPGFYHLTVVDGLGRAARATVRVHGVGGIP